VGVNAWWGPLLPSPAGALDRHAVDLSISPPLTPSRLIERLYRRRLVQQTQRIRRGVTNLHMRIRQPTNKEIELSGSTKQPYRSHRVPPKVSTERPADADLCVAPCARNIAFAAGSQ